LFQNNGASRRLFHSKSPQIGDARGFPQLRLMIRHGADSAPARGAGMNPTAPNGAVLKTPLQEPSPPMRRFMGKDGALVHRLRVAIQR
jgi:hypothetical protein